MSRNRGSLKNPRKQLQKILQNYERITRKQFEAVADVCMDWGYECLDEIVQRTPFDKGDLRKSLKVEINDEASTIIGTLPFDGDANPQNVGEPLTYNVILKEGKIHIVFSSNMIYSYHQHIGEHPSGTKIKNYSEPGTGPYFISDVLNENIDDLVARIREALQKAR